jgi:hypothetical protein
MMGHLAIALLQSGLAPCLVASCSMFGCLAEILPCLFAFRLSV